MRVQTEFNTARIHTLAAHVLESLVLENATRGEGAIVAALALGRLTGGLSHEAEPPFIQAALDFCEGYFIEGPSN